MTGSNRMNVGTRTARAQSLIDNNSNNNNNNNSNPTCEQLPFFIVTYFNFVSFSKFSKERCSNNIISISFTIYFGF